MQNDEKRERVKVSQIRLRCAMARQAESKYFWGAWGQIEEEDEED
jgi:hypothetical protein